MKNLDKRIVLYCAAWFLVLPFPFENQAAGSYPSYGTIWHWFGGWKFLLGELAPILPSDPAQKESWSSAYHYAHTWYAAAFLLTAIALGALSFYALRVVAKRKA